MLNVLYLIVGFALLIKGADWLVDGSSSLAKRLGVSNLVIGLTLVAFGTSAPELAVNVISAIKGTSDIALGNIIGSNIANILLILGLASTIRPLVAQKSTTWKEIPLSALAAVVMGLMINDVMIDHASASMLSRIDGLVLLSFFIIFMYYAFGIAKQKKEETPQEDIKALSSGKAILMTLAGLAALVLGGRWTVDSAVWLAHFIGLSETFIGLTIVAVGTSLPELVTSTVAALKNNFDIALGNIVGSNIFNIFFVLGISSIIRPLTPPPFFNIDICVAIVASLVLFLGIVLSGHPTVFGKRYEITRSQGMFLLLSYAAYIIYIVYRG